MSVISDSIPTAPHMHSSGLNMLETPQSETSPSAIPKFLQSNRPSPTPGLDQRTESTTVGNPVSSISELMPSPDDSLADHPSVCHYVPAGTPGTPTKEEDPSSVGSEFPLLTTFPTEVQASVLPDLAASACDRESTDDKTLTVPAILSADSRNGSGSFEFVESSTTGTTNEKNGLILEESADEVRPDLHPSQSMSASMSLSPSTPIVGDDAAKLPVTPGVNIPQPGTTEESVHLVQNIYAGSEALTQDESIGRSSSMPPFPGSGSDAVVKGFRRSKTELRRKAKLDEDENIRQTEEARLSTRRKKQLLRKLATIKKDGAVEFDYTESSQAAKDLFGFGLTPRESTNSLEAEDDQLDKNADECGLDYKSIPPLRIVMLIVGTRGDVQPFIAIGKRLQEYGHRVRLASHKNFESFVKREGLEFYPLGGDPVVLAGYMVKNKGFLPSTPTEIPVQREQIKSIVYSLLAACREPDLDSHIPFQAQAIIANPPAYGHVHVAEFLKIPLHIFFTMPWTPTSAFPHPLARVKQPAAYRVSATDLGKFPYQFSSMIAHNAFIDAAPFRQSPHINNWRKKKLKLRPIHLMSGSQGSIIDMPTGYIWSPHLVPKPKDWGPLVDVVGFCFLNLATDFKPPEDLMKWLQAGPAPIYIGFGSLPVEDPEGMTKIIIEALTKTGQRGIIGKGWGGIGNLKEVPENVYLVSDCPHDWLFPQCAAVVHHGGAGTTSAGLKASCPTTIIPFFGDQPFWGDRVHEKGVGPVPIPVNHFTLDKLVSAIEYMLDPAVKKKAVKLAEAMESEDGIQGAVNAFHKHIVPHLPKLVCHVEPPLRRKRQSFLSRLSCFSFV